MTLPLFDAKVWPAPNCGSGHGQQQAKERRKRFRNAAATAPVPLLMDTAGARLISKNLELELEPIEYGFQRYAQTGFRVKSQGLGGSLLGDTGEVLTWLLHQSIPSLSGKAKLVRVVGYQALAAKGPFPMPDFLLIGPKVSKAVEVKSREAFDFRAMTQLPTHTAIAGCDALKGAREEALLQIGFTPPPKPPKIPKGSKPTSPAAPVPTATTTQPVFSGGGVAAGAATGPTHNLKPLNRRFVPFPSSIGVAVAVLVRDARLARFHTAAGLTFPAKSNCSKYSCWDCFKAGPNQPTDAVIVEMPNSPGELALPGPCEQPEEWAEKYERWRQALWAREPAATRATTAELRAVTIRWLRTLNSNAVPVATIEAFWGRYLRDVPAELGIPASADGGGMEVNAPGLTPWSPRPAVEAVVVEARMVEGSPLNPSGVRAGRTAFHDAKRGVSACLHAEEQHLRLSVLSPHWWSDSPLAPLHDPSQAIATALEFAGRCGLSLPEDVARVQRVDAQVGGEAVRLGWHASGWVVDGFGVIRGPAAWEMFAYDDGRVLVEAGAGVPGAART